MQQYEPKSILKALTIKKVGNYYTLKCNRLGCKKIFKQKISRVVKEKRGLFCSRKCLYSFVPNQHHLNELCKSLYGKNIKNLQNYIKNKKTTNKQISKKYSYSEKQVSRTFKMFSITPYFYRFESSELECKNCGKIFFKQMFSSRKQSGRGKFCSKECKQENVTSKNFKLTNLLFNWKKYKFLKIGDKIGNYDMLELGFRSKQFVNKDKFDHFFFKKGVKDEKTAYVLGMLLTDGNVGLNKRHKSPYVSLDLIDRQIIEDIARLLKYKLKIHITKKYSPKTHERSQDGHKISMLSRYLFHDLVQLGCVPRKTYITEYPNINPKFDRHFLRGVIDGDGSFYIRNNQLNLKIVGADRFLYGIYLRIKKHLNIVPATIYYFKKEGQKMKNFSAITYHQKFSIKIRDWIYKNSNIYLLRKKDKAYSNLPTPYQDSLNSQKLADLFHIHRVTINKIIEKYGVPHKKIGRYRVLSKDNLIEFIRVLRSYIKTKQSRLTNSQKKFIKSFNINQISI